MRLYSRNQVYLFVAVSVLVTSLILLAVGAVSGIRDRIGSTDAQVISFDGGTEVKPSPIVPVRDIAGYSEGERENIRIYELLNEGVVNITTEKLAFTWFFDPVPQEGGTGSGSIIDAQGYVLTNNHVVTEAYKVYITLADGDRYEGEVIGTDPENDLAVIKFDPGGRDLVTIPLGSSTDLRVGQKVLAIGNPFAFERTLTTGIISGLGRPVRGSGTFVIQDMIQTDASINPGNSGGPLLNSTGQMIGINTMIYSPSGGSVGIGFASPIDTAKRIIPDLIQYGTVRRGWIDIVPVQLEPSIVRYARLPVNTGILVSRVVGRGNADRAGLRGGSERVRYGRSYIYLGGDIIIQIGGVVIETLSDYFSALESTKPGDSVEVVLVRSGRERRAEIILSERPKDFSWN